MYIHTSLYVYEVVLNVYVVYSMYRKGSINMHLYIHVVHPVYVVFDVQHVHYVVHSIPYIAYYKHSQTIIFLSTTRIIHVIYMYISMVPNL